MYAQFKKIAVAALIATFAQSAFADQYQVTVQGQLTKDPFFASIFGITDNSVPVQISFKVESDDVDQFPAGSAVISSSGAGFNSNAQLIPASAVSELTATIGGVSWDLSNLVHRNLGDSGSSYDILLVGDLADGAAAAVQLTLNAPGVGEVSFGAIECGAACNVVGFGSAEDYTVGSVAELTGINAAVEALAPPPSADMLLKDLMTKIKTSTGVKPPLIKIALLAPLAIADKALDRNKTVQAYHSMKAFIALIKPLVKLRTISAAFGEELIADAQEIIDAM